MEHLVFLGAVALFILVMTGLGIRNERRARARFAEKMRASYGKLPDRVYDHDRSLHIPKYHEKHRTPDSLDDITWHDLNMEAVYRRVNYCRSAAGEEMLYHLLRTPDDTDKKSFEEQVSFFDREAGARVQAQVLFENMKQMTKYALYDHLEMLGERKSNLRHILMLVLIAASAVLCAVRFGVFFPVLLLLLSVNLVTYYREKKVLNAYLATFTYVLRLIEGADRLVKLLSDKAYGGLFDAEVRAMREALSVMQPFRRGAFLVMTPDLAASGNPVDIVFDYLRVLTHADLIKFNQMTGQLKAHQDNVDRLVQATGTVETRISVACFRASLEHGFCQPRFTEETTFRLRDAYHLLVEAPVKNSVTCDKNVLITGSNASGKSTFLKTAAICAVLAETIHTVPASCYEAPYYRIFSSMALADDLDAGDSYYIVEIKSLKRILDAADKRGIRVLCFIDEVLRGTNTLERIAASARILKQFAQSNVQCFAATHDGELTGILGTLYDNYHFDGEIKEGDVRFDYRLREGSAKTRNAIQLLHLMGYDDTIVREAEEMAKRFLETGVWSFA